MKAIEYNPNGITQADIVVGIPSYNEAASISYPTQQVDKGLTKHYPDRSAVIINCDNNSPDDTRRAFMETQTKVPKIYLSTEEGVKGKGNNLQNLFTKVVELSAKAVIVVDADLKNIAPRWVRNLGEPLFEDYQFVAPLYVRHKYDGTVTNNIAYPMTRALYGRRVRQPIGGDYGFSGEMARAFVESDFWSSSAANFGVDIWMTTLAVRGHAQVAQSFMGTPKSHKPKDPASAGGRAMFREVVATIFELMTHFEQFWKEVKWSRPTAVRGFGLADVEVPPAVAMDTNTLWGSFTAGLQTHWEDYRLIVAPQNLNKIEEVAGLPADGFEFPTGLWAKTLYDFAVAFKRGSVPADDLFPALLPLFHAKTLSFVLETQPMNTQQVEEYIEDQCLQFEKAKAYLVERWFAG